MKSLKVILWIALALLGCYLLVAVAACLILPAQIADDEARMPAVEQGMAMMGADQQRLSQLLTKYYKLTKDKMQSVYDIMGDPDINRMALNYLGSDFALMRSEFAGKVQNQRKIFNQQKNHYEGKEGRDALQKKLKDLEDRKKRLANTMVLKGSWDTLGPTSSERQWYVEMEDVNRQLDALRAINIQRQFNNENTKDTLARAKATNDNIIFNLTEQYERLSVGRLKATIDAQLVNMRNFQASLASKRTWFSVFNIWPLNELAKMPQRK